MSRFGGVLSFVCLFLDQRRKHNCFTKYETNFSIFLGSVTESSRPPAGHLYTYSWVHLLILVVWRCFVLTTLPGWFAVDVKHRTPIWQDNSCVPQMYLRDHAKENGSHSWEDAAFPACTTPSAPVVQCLKFLKAFRTWVTPTFWGVKKRKFYSSLQHVWEVPWLHSMHSWCLILLIL